MARVSHLRPTISPGRAALRGPRRPIIRLGPLRRGRFGAGGALLLVLVLLVLLAAGVAALLARSAHGSLSSDPSALARVTLPLGGGRIDNISAVTGPHSRPIPVALRGEQIWPRGLIGAHELVSIDVVVRRPGWISWLTGRTERLHLTLMTLSEMALGSAGRVYPYTPIGTIVHVE